MRPVSRIRRNIFQNLTSKNYDWKLLILVVIVSVLGLAFLGSALTVKQQIINDDTTFLREFFKQFVFGVWLGSVAAFILAKVDYHILFKYKKLIIIGTLASLLVIFVPMLLADIVAFFSRADRNVRLEFVETLGFLHYANSTVRWIVIPGITNIQPSEIAKLGLLIYFASYINLKKKFTWDNYKEPFYAFVLASLAILFQPDLGSVVVIGVMILAALWVGKIPFKKIAVIIMILATLGAFFTLSVDYRRQRVETWLAKTLCSSPDSSGYICSKFDTSNENANKSYQVDKIIESISNGGLWGVGYGKSELKRNIPEVSTDGIIGVIGEEIGMVLTIAFLSLYLFIFFRGMKIAKEAPDLGGSALAAGISMWIVFQAFWNVAGMTGVLPMKGLPLPFVSEGGTAMLINLAAIGILLNISSQSIATEHKPKLRVKRRDFKL